MVWWKGWPDDLIIVRELLPAGQLVERLAEDPPVRVLVLHHYGHQLLHLLHETPVGRLLLFPTRLTLFIVVFIVQLLLPLAAPLLVAGGLLVLPLVVLVLVVLGSDGLEASGQFSRK
jgi:hypothetical protein